MRNLNEDKEKDTRRLIVEVGERLFRQIGFQKTTVADIARELHMSPANIYRFFASKAEINEAVCRQTLSAVEAAALAIARTSVPAGQRLREVIASVEKLNEQRYISDRKLHEMVEAAVSENWAIAREHSATMERILGQIIREGMAAGEFRAGDPELAAMLVYSACIRFCHPRLMAECAQDPEPTIDQMVDFCLAALAH
jgi:AcrR family transcriptional regulator